jgi:type I restriction-modification system DNA methylase subunit
MVDSRLVKIQESLNSLEKNRDLQSAKTVVRDVSALLVPDLSGDVDSIFRLFNDQEGKLKANASWFFSDTTITDKLATYTLDTPSESNLDIKVFGVKKAKKGTISWAVGLTPNFEDEPFNSRYNVGIDFIIPESLDRVVIALSKNYVIRTLELKGQLTATFQEILNSWIMITDLSRKVEFHELLWKSLDLSPINKKFYEGISQRFISLRQHIETSGALDKEHAAQFANRLIGRVIFTWFLDKKSLIEPSLKYFESEDYKDDTDYYREKLESLFFEVLNTPVSDRIAADTSTPYLNGGLFEPKPGDLYKDKTLTFPKNFFDDFLGFLRGYNFTTDESTTEFQQVAIDPEMLGRIFENLLAEVNEETGEQARKAKGAFYTPRQIVDFMCREALSEYLRSKLEPSESLDQRLFQLIDASERSFQDQDHNWRRDLKPYKEKIFLALDELRVFDPACGSGAFPIGMLQLLLKVYERLEPRLDSHKVKVAIIERNIFGADIEPMAVEISRLRAWLAMVVELGSDLKSIKPLPNLDFKFVCANTLIALEEQNSLSLVDEEVLAQKLQTLRGQYFKTESSKKKQDLRASYQKLVREELTIFEDAGRTLQLKSFQPFESDKIAGFFDPMQMFGFSSFDIVIANPPYIGEKGNKETFRRVRGSSLGQRFGQGKMDYFYYFFHLAIDNLRDGGIACFITTNYFPTATAAEKLRSELKSKTNILKVVNFNNLKIFKSALGQHNMVTVFSKGNPDENQVAHTAVTNRSGDVGPTVLGEILEWRDTETDYYQITQEQIYSGERSDIVLRAKREVDEILERIGGTQTRLRDEFSVHEGVQTGANSVFVFKDLPVFLQSAAPAEKLLLKKLTKNSDIFRFGMKKPSSHLLYFSTGVSPEKYPQIYKHLLTHKSVLEKRAQIVRSGQPWYQLLWPRSLKLFEEGPKIVAPYRSSINAFCYTEEEVFGGFFGLADPPRGGVGIDRPKILIDR